MRRLFKEQAISTLQNICSILASQLKRICNSFADEDIDRASAAFLGYRDLSEHIVANPTFVFNKLSKNENLNKFCYPCDLLELRTILDNGYIAGSSPIVLFPTAFAMEFFTSYGLFLQVNKISECLDFRSFKIVDKLNLKDKLLGVLVNQTRNPYIRKKAQIIMNESVYKAPIHGFNSIPWISMPYEKVAAGETSSYIVNIKNLGISNWRTFARSEVQAVEEVLQQRWQQLHQDRINRSPKFRVEYWLNTNDAIWNSLVRKADNSKLIKHAQTELNLSAHEQEIFNIIRQGRDAIGPVELRVAGGFVRDKLLGKESDDIDIAIGHMSGIEFVKRLAAQGHPDIAANAWEVSLDKEDKENASPELGVGGIKILGQKIEFVPMRTEAYSEDSRTPQIARTNDVREDVQRRDLTINAMYYNLDTGQVEDYVGGKEDLSTMTLRTPIDPLKTFYDDPLRVMRVLRFFSRYPDAQIEENTLQAMADPKIAEAWHKKNIAPERIGPEMVKMLGGAKPDEAVRILFDTGLDTLAFNIPEMQGLNPMKMDQQTPHHVHDLQEHSIQVLKHSNQLAIEDGASEEERLLGNVVALFHDFGKRDPGIQTPHPKNPDQMQYLGHEEMSARLSDAILKSWGVEPSLRKPAAMLIDEHMKPHVDSWSNKAIGRQTRRIEDVGPDSLDANLRILFRQGKADSLATNPDKATKDVELKNQHYQQFKDYLTKRIPEPLLKGGEIMAEFPGLDPKPPKGRIGFITNIKNRLTELQDRALDPASKYFGMVTNRDEALQYVRSIKDQIMQNPNEPIIDAEPITDAEPSVPQPIQMPQQEPPVAPIVDSVEEEKKPVLAYNRAKLAYNPIGQDQSGFPAPEGGEHIDEINQDNFARPQAALPAMYEGQTVTMRRRGGSFSKIFGKVKSVTSDRIKIKWNDDTEMSYPNDPVFLAYKLQGVN